jgi:hypothetical protein
MKEFKGKTGFDITTDNECSDAFYMQPAPTFGEAEHNATLFEAAPELLESALMYHRWCLDNDKDMGFGFRSAINKALGHESTRQEDNRFSKAISRGYKRERL